MLAAGARAHAATCDRIEYAEARDWPVERLEHAYCQDLRLADIETKRLHDGGPLFTDTKRAMVMAEVSRCTDQAALFGRVLQERKLPRPAC